jgi:hypothetical protein
MECEDEKGDNVMKRRPSTQKKGKKTKSKRLKKKRLFVVVFSFPVSRASFTLVLSAKLVLNHFEQ